MFKVGDKVRIVGGMYTAERFKRGNIVEIYHIYYNYLMCGYGPEEHSVEGCLTFLNDEVEVLKEKDYIDQLKDKGKEIMETQYLENVNVEEFISMDYRTEYYNKVEECEKLKAQLDWLWDSILKGDK